MQQDSEECLTFIQQQFKQANMKIQIDGKDVNLVDYLFKIELETTFTNTQDPSQLAEVHNEEVTKLVCQIDNPTLPVNMIQEGVKLSLVAEVEKMNYQINENQIYRKESKIAKLPQYLFVQLNRFFWKKDSAVAGTKGGKSKILRNVSFPLVFDLYDNCTEDLKGSLKHGRDFEIKQ